VNELKHNALPKTVTGIDGLDEITNGGLLTGRRSRKVDVSSVDRLFKDDADYDDLHASVHRRRKARKFERERFVEDGFLVAFA
jgi:hypothetical protein